MYLCACVCNKPHANPCVIIWCVPGLFVRMQLAIVCVCVIRLHGPPGAQQLFCNGVQWEPVLGRLHGTACTHA